MRCDSTGSPPQVRGKPLYICQAFFAPRITPAGAGKTGFLVVCTEQAEDHPRRCGENLLATTTPTAMTGSPPQVRGKLISTVLQGITQRITPAGAGKTPADRAFGPEVKDHPRRCGENRLGGFFRLPPRGSPPQVRGKLFMLGKRIGNAGITPAGAGKTNHPQGFDLLRRDHPRRCGENSRALACRLRARGSPPQVRGKLSCGISGGSGAGITPAGAGKTSEDHNVYKAF